MQDKAAAALRREATAWGKLKVLEDLSMKSPSKPVRTQHVIPTLNGGWAVFRSGAKRVSRTFGTKPEAIRYATAKAREHSAPMFIHRNDGTVEERR